MDWEEPCAAYLQLGDNCATHLSPAAWLGNDAKRSGCLGRGVSLLVSRCASDRYILEVDVLCCIFRAQASSWVVTQQARHQIQALSGEVLELLSQS